MVLDLCPYCDNHQALHHILNSCSVFLSKGCYTWQLDSVMKHLSLGSAYSRSDNPLTPSSIFKLLAFFLLSQPLWTFCISIHPNPFPIFPNKNVLLELTIRFGYNLEADHSHTSDRYASLSPTSTHSLYNAQNSLLLKLNLCLKVQPWCFAYLLPNFTCR